MTRVSLRAAVGVTRGIEYRRPSGAANLAVNAAQLRVHVPTRNAASIVARGVVSVWYVAAVVAGAGIAVHLQGGGRSGVSSSKSSQRHRYTQ